MLQLQEYTLSISCVGHMYKTNSFVQTHTHPHAVNIGCLAKFNISLYVAQTTNTQPQAAPLSVWRQAHPILSCVDQRCRGNMLFDKARTRSQSRKKTLISIRRYIKDKKKIFFFSHTTHMYRGFLYLLFSQIAQHFRILR